MLQVLSLMSKFAFSPVWLLWKFYGLLWWAFEGSPKPAQSSPRNPERGAAFEVVDSRPREECLPPPTGLLRTGFGGTLAVSGVWGIVSLGLVDAHVLTEPHGWGLWAWASVVTMVGSIFAVRHVAAKRAARRGMWWNAKRAAAGVAQRVSATVGKAVGGSAGATVAAACAAVNAEVNAKTASSRFAARIGPLARDIQNGAKNVGGFAARAARASVAGAKHAAAAYKGASATSTPARAPATSA